MMFSQLTPSNVKQTVVFQTSQQDPIVNIKPDTFTEIAKGASLDRVNFVASSSNTIPT